MVAQFRPAEDGQQVESWWLDFLAQTDPLETKVYRIEYGDGVPSGPERSSGHKLTESPTSYKVSHAPYIDWIVPRNLEGLLHSVEFNQVQHLKPDSPGLEIVDRDGQVHSLGGEGTQSRILRAGTMAVGLRFEKSEDPDSLEGVRWQVDLVFPGPISWVELNVQIEDPNDRVRSARMQLHMNLTPPSQRQRTLVELGASRTVYRSLTGNGQLELRSDPAEGSARWEVWRGTPSRLSRFAVARPGDSSAEGWAHLMDRQRCLALAIARFGRTDRDTIRAGAAGQIMATRDFRPGTPHKNWRSWLHFVHFPPQQSAQTDPQMMQNPLRARQLQD